MTDAPHRRPWVASAARAVVALALAASTSCSAKPRPPDVVVIVMAGTRADRCSFNGYSRPTTPRLAEFAKKAATFTDAWTPGGWAGPALASLFTGLVPERHGFYAGARNRLGDGPATLAERLASAGYATGCFTNDATMTPELGLTRGFDEVEPFFRDEGRPYPWARATHERAADWATATRAAGRPFFLFVDDVEPLLPYTPPPEIAASFVRADASPAEIREVRAFIPPRNLVHDLGVGPLTERQLALMSDLYDGEIATLDEEIGTLLDRLGAQGLLDSAIVVVLSDHGVNLGEHGLVDHLFSLHRTICHVPLIVRIPGQFDRGAEIAEVVRVEDVFPTVLEACGLAPGSGLDGLPLTHHLAGRTARAILGTYESERRAAETFVPAPVAARLCAGIRSVYDGAMHYLRHDDGREELYDVVRDPAEREDLASRRAGDVARMRELRVAPR